MPSSHHSRNASRHAWIPSVSLPNVRDSALDLTEIFQRSSQNVLRHATIRTLPQFRNRVSKSARMRLQKSATVRTTVLLASLKVLLNQTRLASKVAHRTSARLVPSAMERATG